MKVLNTWILELRKTYVQFEIILNINLFVPLCSAVLEKHLRNLTDNVDELLQDTNKFNVYQRQVVKQQQDKQKYTQKRVMLNYCSYHINKMYIFRLCVASRKHCTYWKR